VLHRKLVAELDSLPPEVVLGSVRARLDEALLGTRAKGAAELAEVMSGERYLRLLDSLRVFVEDPPFAPLAARPAGKIEKDVARAGRKFEKRLDAALTEGSDEALHRARKAGKRARYAVEAGAPVLSAGTATVIDAFKDLQDLLGDQHDAVVAADLLLDLGRQAGAHRANGFTFGLLYQRQLDASARLRAEVPASAKSVTGKSLPG
jgi:CHAD domain-containing protein